MTDEKQDGPGEEGASEKPPGADAAAEDIPVEDEPLEEVPSSHTITAKPPSTAMESAPVGALEIASARGVAAVERGLESAARRVERSPNAVTNIVQAYEAFFAASGANAVARRREAIGRLLANVATIEQEHPVPGNIGDFLADIGDSVAAAQERLDELTLEYPTGASARAEDSACRPAFACLVSTPR
jgi:hypothetical protein